MFKDWGFLVTEMIELLIIATLLGLIAGWLIWGRQHRPTNSNDALRQSVTRQQETLWACQAHLAETDTALAALQGDLDALNTALQDALSSLQAVNLIGADDDVSEEVDERFKPTVLAKPRNGQPDDLKQILGIGPRLEQLCHALGVFHYDQIARWTEAEVAWMDANLNGFKGRVSRDHWVQQAKQLTREHPSKTA